MHHQLLRLLLGVALAVGLAALVGCSSQPKLVPISGSVVVDGNPAAVTTLTFWAEDPNAPPGAGGRVVTDEKGEFTIGEKEKGTGLPPGDYKVTFSRFVDSRGSAVHGGGKKSEAEYEVPSRESIPESHRDRNTTPVTANVSSSSNTFKFEIATKAR